MANLEDLKRGAAVKGILPDCLITVVDIKWYGSATLELTYKDPTGKPGVVLLDRDREPNLEIVENGRPLSFDGDRKHLRVVSKRQRGAMSPPATKQAAIGNKRGDSAKANLQNALNLTSLCNGMGGLTSACGAVLAESAAVCLEDRRHVQGVILNLAGEAEAAYPLNWQPVDEQQRRCHNDLQEATERGASGIAILLIERLTGLTVLERSKKRTGFDYWIGLPGDGSLLFQGKARLEVSGILKGTTSAVASRVKAKLAQVKPTDKEAPAYIAVVEFGSPVSQVVYKCQT
jgi:hypothetical protein